MCTFIDSRGHSSLSCWMVKLYWVHLNIYVLMNIIAFKHFIAYNIFLRDVHLVLMSTILIDKYYNHSLPTESMIDWLQQSLWQWLDALVINSGVNILCYMFKTYTSCGHATGDIMRYNLSHVTNQRKCLMFHKQDFLWSTKGREYILSSLKCLFKETYYESCTSFNKWS